MSTILIVLLLVFIIICVISARKELKKEGGYENYKKKYHVNRNENRELSIRKYEINYDGRAEIGQQYPFDIVGEASYQKNIKKFAKFRGDRDCFTELTATITREPNNSHDKNACRVDINGLTVGYFARNHAESWVRLLNKLEIPENSIFYVDAVIVGGGGDRFLGVRLNMPPRIANTSNYLTEVL
jgi:hypothetical protein